MAIGIIATMAITIIITFIAVTAMKIMKLKGFNEGMMSEAKQWVAAIEKVRVPNWQSMPVPPGEDPERAKLAAQIYVEAFKVALDVIKEEIAVNRLNAIVVDIQKMTQDHNEARYPIA